MPPEIANGYAPDPEVVAWEKFAAEKKLNMECHPLHYLFLDKATYLARQSWKGAIAHMREGKQLTEIGVDLVGLDKYLPIEARVIQRPTAGLRNVIQWTRRDEEMADGEELVRRTAAEAIFRQMALEIDALKKKNFKLENHALNVVLNSVPKPALKTSISPPWPDDSPFGIPAIVEDKVSLQEVIDLIAKHTNKEYMPYSKSEKHFNSKPEYIKHANSAQPEFPNHQVMDGMCYYIHYLKWDSGLAEGPYHEGRWHHPKSIDHTFASLRFKKVEVCVNLTTLATIVRTVVEGNPVGEIDGPWYPWSPELNLSIAIEREAFADHDSYNF